MVCLSSWFLVVVSVANAKRVQFLPDKRDVSPLARLLSTALLVLNRPLGSGIERRRPVLSSDARALRRNWIHDTNRIAQASVYARRPLAKPRVSKLVSMNAPNMPTDYMSSHGLLYEEWGASPMQYLNETVTFQEAARNLSFSRYDAVLIAADRANQIFRERGEEEQNDAEANGWFSRGGRRKPKPEHSDVNLAVGQLMQQYKDGGELPEPLPRGLTDDELEEVYHLMQVEKISQTEALQILSEKQAVLRKYGLAEEELEQVHHFMQEENITQAQAVQVLQQLKTDSAQQGERNVAIQQEHHQDSIEPDMPSRGENDYDDLEELDFEDFLNQKDGTKIQQPSESDASLDLLLKALTGDLDEKFVQEKEEVDSLTAAELATASLRDGEENRDAVSHSNEFQPHAVLNNMKLKVGKALEY